MDLYNNNWLPGLWMYALLCPQNPASGLLLPVHRQWLPGTYKGETITVTSPWLARTVTGKQSDQCYLEIKLSSELHVLRDTNCTTELAKQKQRQDSVNGFHFSYPN